VHVDKSHYVIFLSCVYIWILILDQLLYSAHNRMQLGVTRLLPSVNTTPRHRNSVIPNNSSIRVRYWNYSKHDSLPELNSNLVRGICDELNEPLHHEGGIRLSRVDPPNDNNYLLLLELANPIVWEVVCSLVNHFVVWLVYTSGNYEVRDIYTAKARTQYCLF
jgi:hypothetical protein